jgi:hypothetical protein
MMCREYAYHAPSLKGYTGAALAKVLNAMLIWYNLENRFKD